MSIADQLALIPPQIDRLKAAKAALVAAITAKGVSVPESVLLDALDAYVALIQTGADVSGVTTAAADVLAGKKFVDANGVLRDGTMPSKVAATYTPGTSNQTIAAGQYLAGAQTIKGDANLVAANIKSGVSIFGIAGALSAAIAGQGTVHGRKFVSGTFTPTVRTTTTGAISHGLGVVPKGIVLWAESSVDSPSSGDIYATLNIDFGATNSYGNACGVQMMSCAGYSGAQFTGKSGLNMNIDSYPEKVGSFITATTTKFEYGYDLSYSLSYIGSNFSVKFIPVTYKYILFGG